MGLLVVVAVWVVRGVYAFGILDGTPASSGSLSYTVPADAMPQPVAPVPEAPAWEAEAVPPPAAFAGVPPAAVEMAFADPYQYDLEYESPPRAVEREARRRAFALLGPPSALDSIRVRSVAQDGRRVATVLVAGIDPALVGALQARGPFFLGAAETVPVGTGGPDGGFDSYGIKPYDERRRIIFLNGLVFDITGTPSAVRDLSSALGFANM